MKKLFLALAAILPFLMACNSEPTLSMKVMSYNIRFGTADDDDNIWPNRCEAVAAMINDQLPAVFGVQEALDFQLTYLDEHCPTYAHVGVGREDGISDGEHMAVFYNTDLLELQDWGTYWLSETPDVPSKGWDGACKRTATWTLLKDIGTGKQFYFVDTHLDHVGQEARRNGLILLVERIGAMNPDGYPMILCGDFNSFPDDPCFTDLRTLMLDARETAAVTDTANTFHGWGEIDQEPPIDYIFYKGFQACESFQRVTQEYLGRKYVSDHYPITAVLDF